MKHIVVDIKDNCAGCTACVAVCPAQCITMEEDEEGFLYPCVSEVDCIDCGLCVNTCPILKVQYVRPASTLSEPKVFAVKHKSDEVRRKSTSGGVFTSLSDCILDEGGIVCGAVFDEDSQGVKHIIATKKDERNRMRGSKYVQSDLCNVYSEIKLFLQTGRKVLFTGTPCQTAGLIAFLKKDYPNLFVADILCHSVSSPLIFKHAIGRRHVKNICFRNKELGWRGSYEFSIDTDDGRIVNTSYLALFFKGLINRPSCSKCHFTNLHRPSDITLGDYWNINRIDNRFEDKLGVSCVVVNTQKGLSLLQSVSGSLDAMETDVHSALQTCMERPTRANCKRDEFWEVRRKMGTDYAVEKYCVRTKSEIIKDKCIAPVARAMHLNTLIHKLRKL